MRCKTVKERLDDHVDGLLPAEESGAIRDHLDLCTDCRETAMATKAATDSLAMWDDIEPPADCFDKILVKLEALPLEVYEHARPAAPRGFFSRLPSFHAARAVLDTARSVRARRVLTGGLAAAATVLGAALVVRTEAHAPRRSTRDVPVNGMNARGAAAPVESGPALWQPGYEFDDGLYYGTPAGPAAQPMRRPRVRTDLLEPSAR